MTVEDRSHRSHKLNPRRWPTGREYHNNLENDAHERLGNIVMLSDSEGQFIQDVPRLLGDGFYANLGHAGGGSAILMASCIKELKLKGCVYSVDLFPKDNKIERCQARLEEFGVGNIVNLLQGSTDEWADRFGKLNPLRPFETNHMFIGRDEPGFNFVFIDADHTYEAVKRDFLNWGQLVKPGGWVSFHDTNQDFSHNAIEETVAELWPERSEYHVDRIRTFQRPL